MEINTKIKIILGIVVILAIGFGAGYWIEYGNSRQQIKSLVTGIVPVRENNFNYKFIYPLLRYDFKSAKSFFEDKNLEQKMNDYIQQQYQLQNAQSISVYFNNLSNGQWSGVNANTQYHPGSMMKVLIMMGYYREAQLNPSIMESSSVYNQDIEQTLYGSLNFAQPSNLVIGQSYTTKQLLEDMIENSDNGAEAILYNNINKSILNAVYEDLNIASPDSTPDYTISTVEFSTFLRILYNSTYLTEANSEDALSVMSKSTFNDGISAGVPSTVLVAHKYGERVDSDPTGKVVTGTELHDCGIVYAPAYPYELCVMTKANGAVDEKQLDSIIKDISRIAYDYGNSGTGK